MFALTLSTFSVASWAKEKIEGNGEEKRFIEQHIRETTEAQIRFMNQQNKKRNRGIEM